jgi:hypothetical protein
VVQLGPEAQLDDIAMFGMDALEELEGSSLERLQMIDEGVATGPGSGITAKVTGSLVDAGLGRGAILAPARATRSPCRRRAA